ncbi:hypothetical protein KIJ05_03130 [Leuconostoc gelidum subsp. gasicomitatum]|uniref:hypothetical protein n=1 Tax=Leuconostoc gasicomitatum TaxID=115778 RepID=UPI001CC81D8A|nr:hypothetical protein [Leuconostoc gasicomitatum]MBZ5984129.1 hypothetical protein [Leuconostoc gasicomitatum]
MSSILDEQLRLMALKQTGIIKTIKTPDISEADLLLILKNKANKNIKQLVSEKLKQLNIQAIQKYLNLYHKFTDFNGMATYRARTKSIIELKKRYAKADPDEKAKILNIIKNIN